MGWSLLAEVSAFVSSVLAHGAVVATGTAASVLSLAWSAATKKWTRLGEWRFQPWMLGTFGLALLFVGTFLAWRDEHRAHSDLARQLADARIQADAAIDERDRLHALLDSSNASIPAQIREAMPAQIRDALALYASPRPAEPASPSRRTSISWGPTVDGLPQLRVSVIGDMDIGPSPVQITQLRPWSPSLRSFIELPSVVGGPLSFRPYLVGSLASGFPGYQSEFPIFGGTESIGLKQEGNRLFSRPFDTHPEWRVSVVVTPIRDGMSEETGDLCFSAASAQIRPLQRCRQ